MQPRNGGASQIEKLQDAVPAPSNTPLPTIVFEPSSKKERHLISQRHKARRIG
ncbi:MAG: hypothetical protein LQ343_005696 [Gyalolechia ehrenbergii]|nr:MAG: hypothetical protein LQ343_005696 [Gyalolechia ehrenbergii]